MYSQLVGELTLKIDKYEQALDLADTQGRTFVRTPLVQTLRLSTKELKADIAQAEGMLKAALKPIRMPVELEMKVNGTAVVIERSRAVSDSMKGAEATIKQLQSALSSLDSKGYGAFASTLRGAEDVEKATEAALRKLAEIGRVKAPSSNWSQSVGAFQWTKAAEADLKAIGASLEKDAQFTADFTQHLKQMEGLLEEATGKGAALARALESADNAETKAHSGANWKEQIATVAAGISVYNLWGQAVNVVVSGLKEGVEYNARMQQTLQGFQTQLDGSSQKAKALYIDLEALNDKSSLRESDLFPAAQKLLAARVPLDQLKVSLQAIDDQTAALGGDGGKFSQISTALGQIFLKPRLQAEELTRQLIEAGVPAFDLLAKAYHTNTAQIQEWISKGMIPGTEAFKALTTEMERANFGAAERQSRTLAGAFSTLADRTERTLGAALSGTSGELTTLLNRLVFVSNDKGFQEWVIRISKAVLQGFTFVGSTIKDTVLSSLEVEKLLVEKSGQALSFWVANWRASAGFVWDVLKETAHNMAFFADASTWITQKGLGGAGDFFEKSLDGLIGKAESAAAKGKVAVSDFVADFQTAWGQTYGLPKGLDLGKLWEQSGRYADGLLGNGAKPPAEYNPQLGSPKADGAAKDADKLAAAYEKSARAAEDWGKRQLNALKSVTDTLHTLFGSIQSDLAKYGVFGDSALDTQIAKLQQILDLGGRAQGIVAHTLQVSGDDWNKANLARQQAQTMRDGATIPAAAPSAPTGAFPVSTAMRAVQQANEILRRNSAQISQLFNGLSPVSNGTFPASTVGAGSVDNRSFDSALTNAIIAGINTPMGAMACARFVSRAFDILGINSVRRTDNAAQLERNAIAAGARRIPLSMAGEGDLLVGPGGGPSGRHVGVGVGNGMFAAKNRDRYSKIEGYGFDAAYDTSALAGRGTAVSLRIPSFMNNPLGQGDAATLQSGDNGPQAFLQSVQDMLAGLRIDKLQLPKAWGAPISEAADNAMRFKAQMMLADTATQQLYRSLLGDSKFALFVKQLRAATNEADAFLGRLRAGKGIADELRALETKSRTRGRDNDPFLVLEERRRPGGDLAAIADLSAFQAKAMAARATALEAVVKINTLAARVQGPTLPDAKIKEMAGQAADLRRTIADSNNFHLLQAKVLQDALDTQTLTIKDNTRAIQDRKKALEAGAKFVTEATFDEAGYARAIELRGKEIEYWGRADIKALAGQASALEALAQANTLAKGAQGPVNPGVNVAQTLAAAHKIRLTLNQNAASFLGAEASGYDFEKAFGRTIEMATLRQNLDRQLAGLQAQLSLTQNLTLSQGDLDAALQKEASYRTHLYELTDKGYGDRADALAHELSNMEAYNALVEKAIAAQKDWNKSVHDASVSTALNATLRNLYATMRGDSPQLSRAVFEAQTRSELGDRYNQGEFDVPINGITTALRIHRGIATAPDIRRDPLELEKRVQQALAGFDDKTKTDRVAELSARLAQVQTDLLQRQLEIARPLSEARKAALEFDRQGVALTTQEADLRAQILATTQKISDLQVKAWSKQQMGLSALRVLDPQARADQQFRLDHADMSDEDIARMLPLDRIQRQMQQKFDEMKGLQDDFASSWQSMFRDISKGQFTFGAFLDNIANRLIQWGADTLSSAAFKGLEGLFGKLAGSIIGGAPNEVVKMPTNNGFVAPGFAKGLDFVPYDNFAARLHLGEMVLPASEAHNYRMMQAAQDTMGMSARQGAAMNGGDTYITNNITHTGDIRADSPSDYRRQMAEEMQPGARDSRRTVAKKGQMVIGIPR